MTAREVLARFAGPLVLLATLAIALMYWQGRHEDAKNAARDRAAAEHVSAVVECQARFNGVVVELIKVREELRRERDLAAENVFRRLADIIGAAQAGRDLQPEFARFRVADAAYEEAIRRLHAYKKANPLPEFPDCEARVTRAERASPSSAPRATPPDGSVAVARVTLSDW